MTSTLLVNQVDSAQLAAEALEYQRRCNDWDALLPTLQSRYLHRWVAIRSGEVVASSDDLLRIGEKVCEAGLTLEDVFIDYVRDGTESYIL